MGRVMFPAAALQIIKHNQLFKKVGK